MNRPHLGRVDLEFFYDFSSPFGYLASTAVEEVASRHQAKVRWRPLLLGALFRNIGTPLVPIATMPPAKQQYIMKDMARWAEYRGVELRFPTGFPLRTVKPLRLVLAAGEEAAPMLTHRLMRACWVEDLNPDDEAVLARCVAEVGGDSSWLAKISEPEIKEALRTNTEEAASRGVPGVPTFFVGDQMFWGQDRLDFVDKALGGWVPEVQ